DLSSHGSGETWPRSGRKSTAGPPGRLETVRHSVDRPIIWHATVGPSGARAARLAGGPPAPWPFRAIDPAGPRRPGRARAGTGPGGKAPSAASADAAEQRAAGGPGTSLGQR